MDRVERRHGDFVTVAPKVPAADDVILDRVVCCYPDADAPSSAPRRSTHGGRW